MTPANYCVCTAGDQLVAMIAVESSSLTTTTTNPALRPEKAYYYRPIYDGDRALVNESAPIGM